MAERSRFGDFLFKIFGPATVEGPIQGWSKEAQDQWKKVQAQGRKVQPAVPDNSS